MDYNDNDNELPSYANYMEHYHRHNQDNQQLPPAGDEPATGGRLHTRVFQQSVTMTAKMWPDSGGGAGGGAGAAGGGGWRWGSWRVPAEYLPLLVGTVCGGALLLLLLAAAVVWRCCVVPRRDKAYCARLAEEAAARQRARSHPQLPSHSEVYAAPKSGHWAYGSRLVGGARGSASSSSVSGIQGVHQGIQGVPTPPPGAPPLPAGQRWVYTGRALTPLAPQNIPRSASYGHSREPVPSTSGLGQEKRRRPISQPISQPIKFGPCDPVSTETRCHHLPEISEFHAQSNQYASSSILDEVGARGEPAPGAATLKTRSLPAWVRSRSRPLSTEDDLAELYAKVNFSKKRKNRMRNDEAAIIALSKSRSQYLHKDTDSLVNNEAVIVYDERTAL